MLAASLTAALPWLVAAAVSSGWAAAGAQQPGVTAFAARAEPGLGTLGSLAGLGGIWNAEAVPASRTTLFAVLSTVVLLAVVVVGLPTLLRRRAAVPLVVVAAAAVVVPALMATGPGLAAVAAVIEAVPGLGVVRDGQKWVALAMPAYALAGAAAVVTLRPRVPAPAAAALCCAAVVAVLPDLAWGVGGRVTPVRLSRRLVYGRGRHRRRTASRSPCCRSTACARSRGPVRRRCSTRCRAGCVPTCSAPAT